MKMIIHGASGRMGKNLVQLAGENLAAAVSPELTTDPEKKTYYALAEFAGQADMIVDFSHHTTVGTLLDYAKSRKLPVVIGTTGHTEEEKALIEAAAQEIPVFYSRNMSVGVALLVQLARQTARVFPDAEIEIVEIHHDQKLDVPSGTALMLAEGIKEVRQEATFNIGRPNHGKRTKEEIGIHALRLGNVVGVHEVLVSTGTQTITLKHEAHDRMLFAQGAMTAADYLLGKAPGLYNMDTMLA
jgi:4-hydroxy-tetrahydrodipicolinate reductase